ncbi:MAG: N-formylglutamate amidohydrolase [Anaerolineae bacterium]|nr:N-formylglutamate amidohydrolase [Anaerolineae bacterium]
MLPSPWTLKQGNGPLVATAIHHGHLVRPEVADLLALSEADRLREEDPFTGQWVTVADTQILIHQSRFEVDLNRPRKKAVYLTPADAWGLQVWQTPPPPELVDRSLAQYSAFYAEVKRVFADLASHFGRFVVFDLHSYNHRRDGPQEPPADPAQNPEVNIGTGTMDRAYWAPIVERFIADLRDFEFLGRHLDVRENVKFFGGRFPRWIHRTFPQAGCALAIEFKKFFMDEWTGQPDQLQLEAIQQALQSTVPGVLDTLEDYGSSR